VAAKKEEKVEDARPYGKADLVIPASFIKTGYPNILYSLQGVAGLLVNPALGGVLFTRAASISALGTLEPLVTVNDVPVNISILTTIDPNTVASIEITKRINVLYGSAGRNGVIAIYTKKGVDETGEASKKIPLAKVFGYTKPRKFTAPNYDVLKNTNTADLRATLYWNPEIKINPKASPTGVFFFAADLPTTYKIIVEGINEMNEPIHGEYHLTINN
jgi:hypothetical protein